MSFGAGGAMHGAVSAFLLAFPALFSIVNPLAGAIIFGEATANETHGARLLLARRIGVYAALVMLVSLWLGAHILAFFGISIEALRIAGGLVVAVRGWEMLATPDQVESRKEAQAAPVERSARPASAYAFFPLTMPFTTGPGTIAVAVALGADRPEGAAGIAFFVGGTLAAIALAVVIWGLYATADRLGAVLGASGRQVVSRIAAFLLLCIGVQIALGGIEPLLRQALHS